MFSRLFKTPKSSLQLFRKNQAAMLPNDAESPQFPSETFSSLPIIWKVGLTNQWFGDYVSEYNFAQAIADRSTVPLFYSRRVPEVG